MNVRILIILVLLCSVQIHAAIDESFENGLPNLWTSSNKALKISDLHYKDGKQSLEWIWEGGDVLTADNLQSQGLIISEVEGYYDNTFRMWVYNSERNDQDSVVISFLDEHNTVQYYYHFYLNFKGWRAVSISYRYEMNGIKSSQNLQKMKIQAPANGQGTLFFDYVDFTTGRITGSAASTHLPYKRTIGDNHWSYMLHYSTLPRSYEGYEPSSTELEELRSLKAEVYDYIKGGAPSSSSMNNAINSFNKLNITTNSDGTVKGKPLYGGDGSDSENITVMNDIILQFARDYVYRGTQDSRNKFMLMVKHTHDQGYNYGSVLESVHHIGYDFRQYPLAILLMEDELKKEGLWEEAYDMVCWFVALDGIWEPTAEVSNMDAGNTRTIARYVSLFFKETEAEQVQYLKGFRDYIQNWAVTYPQRGEGIKTDYTGFHHNFYYPARYVAPAYRSICWAVEKMAGTSYDVSPEAKEVLKKVMLVQRLSTNSMDYPMSIAGRGSPFTTLKSTTYGMADLAVSYPTTDKQLAEAVNRENPSIQISGFGREDYPNGFWQLNYGTMGIYRYGSWVANIKGFNNHFLGQEIYAQTSQYSRYAAYGALEVMYPGGNSASGRNINGLNWNVIPGTTTIHLPWDQLYAGGRLDERTDSEFAGALRFGAKDEYYLKNEEEIEGQIGVFGMNFRQKDLSATHNPSFVFRKSVFCVDGLMICLGSGISNNDADNITATNIFQNYLSSTEDRIIIDNTFSTIFPQNKSYDLTNENHWMLDATGTGYLVKKGQGTLRVNKKNQSSPSWTGSGTTNGNIAIAYIDHGTTPGGAGYDYLVIPATDAREMRALADTVDQTYQVLTSTNSAHIVQYKEFQSYALFSENTDLENTIIRGNSKECLAIVKKIGDTLHCSVNKPSIIFGEDGLATSETIRLTVNGFYDLQEGLGVEQIGYGEHSTIFEMEVKNAEPVDFVLVTAPRIAVSLSPVHDAYYSTKSYNNSSIRLANGTRDGYLMFDLSGNADSIVYASLSLQYSGASFVGSVILAVGDSCNWEETNLNSDNKPEIVESLDTVSTQFQPGEIYKWIIPFEKLDDKDKVSFLLFLSDGSSATFASKESPIEDVHLPSLDLITYSTNLTNAIPPVGLDDHLFNVYPNPFNRNLKLSNSEPGLLSVFNVNGQMEYSCFLNQTGTHCIPELDMLKNGVYILQFTTPKTTSSQRVLKL